MKTKRKIKKGDPIILIVDINPSYAALEDPIKTVYGIGKGLFYGGYCKYEPDAKKSDYIENGYGGYKSLQDIMTISEALEHLNNLKIRVEKRIEYLQELERGKQ